MSGSDIGVATDMVINPRIGIANRQSNSNTSSDMVSQIVSGIQGSVNGSKTQAAGNISIPVYLGGTLLDEVVVNAQTRRNLRSGGR